MSNLDAEAELRQRAKDLAKRGEHAALAGLLANAMWDLGYPIDLSIDLLDACRLARDRRALATNALRLVRYSAEPQRIAVEAARRMPMAWAEAVAFLRLAAVLVPDKASTVDGLVRFLDGRGAADEAQRQARHHDILTATPGGMSRRYAYEAWLGGRWAKAAAWFERLVAIVPGDFRVRSLQQVAFERWSKERAFPGTLPIAGLLDRLLPAGERTSMLIIGARDENINQRFRGIPPGRLEVIGVDPELGKVSDPAATEIAVRYLREVLSDRVEDRSFYETRNGGGSSLFRPAAAAARYMGPTGLSWGEQLRVAAERPVRTSSVDAVRQHGGLGRVDALYVNIQGGELAVLRGGRRTFADTVAVQVEVSFISHYEGAPDWRAVDTELVDQGFSLVDLRSLNSAGRTKVGFRGRTDNRLGYDRWPSRQLAEAHLLYLRDPLDLASRGEALFRSARDWLVFAVWAEHYGQIEIALEALMTLVDEPGLVEDPENVAGLAAGLGAVVERYRSYLGTHFP